jgi:hypothetical protein
MRTNYWIKKRTKGYNTVQTIGDLEIASSLKKNGCFARFETKAHINLKKPGEYIYLYIYSDN